MIGPALRDAARHHGGGWRLAALTVLVALALYAGLALALLAGDLLISIEVHHAP